jgi:hypothetical protein
LRKGGAVPTLRPQRLSGLVVIPTVESGGGIHRVSIAIDVGASRVGGGAPPPEVVSREDLVVELRNPAEGSFEPIASPDPGPLPVRALRVVQARGEFTFAQGVNAPTELVVTLRGDHQSFPMAQTLAPTRCLGQEPQEGDAFPASPATASPLRRRLPKFPALMRPRCYVRRFEAPLNSTADASAKSEFFEMEADFAERRRRCRCGCCEYRQFVRGAFSDAGGATVRFDLPSGPLDSVDYCEDGAIDEFGPGRHGYYGHRDTSSPGDAYSGPDATKGCTYRADEKPSCPPTDGVHLEFLGLIVDRCRGRVAAKRKWVVDL